MCLSLDSLSAVHGEGEVTFTEHVVTYLFTGVAPMMYSLASLREVRADDVTTLDARLVRVARVVQARAALVLTDSRVLVVQCDSTLHANDVRATLAHNALVTQQRVYVQRLDAQTLLVGVTHA